MSEIFEIIKQQFPGRNSYSCAQMETNLINDVRCIMRSIDREDVPTLLRIMNYRISLEQILVGYLDTGNFQKMLSDFKDTVVMWDANESIDVAMHVLNKGVESVEFMKCLFLDQNTSICNTLEQMLNEFWSIKIDYHERVDVLDDEVIE